MPYTDTTPAFVLRTIDYSDRDIIVSLLGPQTGRFSAIAKNARGSKRRFGGGIQPMRLIEATYTTSPSRNLARLDEIDIREDYPRIEADYTAIAVGSYATELVRELTVDDDPDPGLFELLRRFYRKLNDADPDPLVLEVALRHFQLAFFERLGSPPALDACFRCGRPVDDFAKIYAKRSGEGVVCPECVRTGEAVGVVAEPTLELLRYLRAPEGRPPEALRDSNVLAQARRLIDAVLERLLARPLRSREMLESALADAGGAPDLPAS